MRLRDQEGLSEKREVLKPRVNGGCRFAFEEMGHHDGVFQKY